MFAGPSMLYAKKRLCGRRGNDPPSLPTNMRSTSHRVRRRARSAVRVIISSAPFRFGSSRTPLAGVVLVRRDLGSCRKVAAADVKSSKGVRRHSFRFAIGSELSDEMIRPETGEAIRTLRCGRPFADEDRPGPSCPDAPPDSLGAVTIENDAFRFPATPNRDRRRRWFAGYVVDVQSERLSDLQPLGHEKRDECFEAGIERRRRRSVARDSLWRQSRRRAGISGEDLRAIDADCGIAGSQTAIDGEVVERRQRGPSPTNRRRAVPECLAGDLKCNECRRVGRQRDRSLAGTPATERVKIRAVRGPSVWRRLRAEPAFEGGALQSGLAPPRLLLCHMCMMTTRHTSVNIITLDTQHNYIYYVE